MLAVDSSFPALLAYKAAFEQVGVAALRVDTMREAISLLLRGEAFKFVVINEDSIPDFMDFLPILCNAARTHVFVTSHSYNKSKHTKAMRAGADAYVPFGQTAKEDVECALEHLEVEPKWKQREARLAQVLVGGELVLSLPQRKAYVRDKLLNLSTMNFDILHYFILNANIVLSYEQVFHTIWGREYGKRDHNRLYNHIYALRQEIKPVTGGWEYIRTEKDYGYLFLPPYNAFHCNGKKLA
jgi:DNA-binding response OmpR family regulator